MEDQKWRIPDRAAGIHSPGINRGCDARAEPFLWGIKINLKD
jgi:hypothetical protein